MFLEFIVCLAGNSMQHGGVYAAEGDLALLLLLLLL
jgi:hypothetical protein